MRLPKARTRKRAAAGRSDSAPNVSFVLSDGWPTARREWPSHASSSRWMASCSVKIRLSKSTPELPSRIDTCVASQ